MVNGILSDRPFRLESCRTFRPCSLCRWCSRPPFVENSAQNCENKVSRINHGFGGMTSRTRCQCIQFTKWTALVSRKKLTRNHYCHGNEGNSSSQMLPFLFFPRLRDISRMCHHYRRLTFCFCCCVSFYFCDFNDLRLSRTYFVGFKGFMGQRWSDVV